MVDYFALALSHGLLLLAGWRMVQRSELDREPKGAAKDAQASSSTSQ